MAWSKLSWSKHPCHHPSQHQKATPPWGGRSHLGWGCPKIHGAIGGKSWKPQCIGVKTFFYNVLRFTSQVSSSMSSVDAMAAAQKEWSNWSKILQFRWWIWPPCRSCCWIFKSWLLPVSIEILTNSMVFQRLSRSHRFPEKTLLLLGQWFS